MARSAPSDPFRDGPSSLLEAAELRSLFEEHWPRLAAIVRRRMDPSLGVQLDAEEIVNATFMDAQRRWPAYRANPKVSPFVWLYRLVNDRLIEAWRTATRQKRDLQRNIPWPERPSIDLGLRLIAPGTSPSQAMLRRERAELMQQALASLRDADREIIMLRSYEDLSYQEIGELLELSENTATLRYVRALRKLKEAWTRLAGESCP